MIARAFNKLCQVLYFLKRIVKYDYNNNKNQTVEKTPRGCLNSIHVSSNGEPYRSRGYVDLLKYRFARGVPVSRRNPNRSQLQKNDRTG